MVTQIQDPKTKEFKKITVTKDEGPRAGLKAADLEKLGPAFQKGGSTTAGNSSQMTDGAAMVLIATRKRAKEYFRCIGVNNNTGRGH